MAVGHRLRWLDGQFTIHRFGPDEPIPHSAITAEYVTICRTPCELTVVAPQSMELSSQQSDPGWAAFVFDGVLDFSLTGVLAGVAQPLAEAGISIYAISTFDTDYVMVKGEQRGAAEQVLIDVGYDFTGGAADGV